jgi:F420-0:gamma-glutamyl ligase
MGFHGVKSYVGKPDIFGRPFAFSKVNIVDALATAAVHTMGE